ncbi:hypothetical protein DPMN_033072 [Dreissena polymorpha]|uniref:Uncharacterized protein n=1 Tax=Dreissena polymorpha TaxID=45954 RepID=A0A9D4M5A0_DREPO|nr:hypothetical protein DPMN_033072 [Dreissena polymorpha]
MLKKKFIDVTFTNTKPNLTANHQSSLTVGIVTDNFQRVVRKCAASQSSGVWDSRQGPPACMAT